MLTKQDLLPPAEEKLSGHDRRKKQKQEDAEIVKAKEYGQQMQDISLEFFNDKILPCSIPVAYLEEGLPKMIVALIKIYKGKSKEFKKAMELKEEMEQLLNLTLINKFEC